VRVDEFTFDLELISAEAPSQETKDAA